VAGKFFQGGRVEEPRFYSAWRPTNTPAPNFHVPEAFGALVFTELAANWGLAKALIFFLCFGVMRVRLFVLCGLIIVLSACYGSKALVAQTAADASSPNNSPVVTKVEPPNWWLRLTPELMVLLSGRTWRRPASPAIWRIWCERTQATAGGDYLFVWLKLDRD